MLSRPGFFLLSQVFMLRGCALRRALRQLSQRVTPSVHERRLRAPIFGGFRESSAASPLGRQCDGDRVSGSIDSQPGECNNAGPRTDECNAVVLGDSVAGAVWASGFADPARDPADDPPVGLSAGSAAFRRTLSSERCCVTGDSPGPAW